MRSHHLLPLSLACWWTSSVRAFVNLSPAAKGVSSQQRRRPPLAVANDLLEGLSDVKLPNSLLKAFDAPEASLESGSSNGEFDPSPSGLIQQAKRVVISDLGLQDASLLDDTKFMWIGPVVDKPLGKREYLAAGRFFDVRSAFPDLDHRAHDFRVDEEDDATVRMTARVTGTMRGELRLRSEVLQPTGQKMVCPPEAISMTFDKKTGKLTKLVTGFGLDRLVGNTGGTTGVMAAAVIGGQDVSDWEVYPPTTCIQRFFGRPVKQLPEAKAFLAPFPETVMIQLAKGILAADMAADDPTLLADDFSFCTPYVGPVNKKEFLEKYASEEFSGIDPSFSYFRVDPYDPVRVWVDVKPSAPGFEGPPQAMSFTFDDEGFCTRITSWAVMDPSVGNAGGLGGPEGFKYAVGEASPAIKTRPLPRALGRLRKRSLEIFTGMGVDEYSLPGGKRTSSKETSVPEPKVTKTTTPMEKLSSLRAQALPSLTEKKDSEFAEIEARKSEAERRLRDAQARQKAAAAERERQLAQQQETERKKKEAQQKQAQAAAEKQRQLAQQKEAQAKTAAEKQRQLAQRKEAERKKQEAQAKAAAEKQEQLAAQKAEAERKRKEAQQKQAEAAAERERQAAEKKAAAEQKRREAVEQQAQAAAEKQRQIADQKAEAERKKKEAAAAERKRKEALEQQAQAAAEKQRQLAEQKAEAERKKKQAAAERERQLAEKKAAAERKQRELEEARRLQLEAQKAENLARVEEQRLKQAVSKSPSGATLNIFNLGGGKTDEDSQQQESRKAAALDAASKAKPGASISLFGLGGGTEQETEKKGQKAARDAASKASPGASISLFGLGGGPKKDTQKNEKAARDAASRAPPGASISLFGLGGGPKQDAQKNQKAARAAASNASPGASISLFGLGGQPAGKNTQAAVAAERKRKLAEQKSEAERKRKAQQAEKERLAEERRSKQLAAVEQKRRDLAAKKAAADKLKRQKSAVDSLSSAASGSTLSLFGLGGGGGKSDSASRPVAKAAPPARSAKKMAPTGVPTLTKWRKNRDGSVTGVIRGAKNFRDGERVTTSPIAAGSISAGEVVRTGSGSRYFLS